MDPPNYHPTRMTLHHNLAGFFLIQVDKFYIILRRTRKKIFLRFSMRVLYLKLILPRVMSWLTLNRIMT